MIERFDHRPKLTAALAMSTIVLFVAVVTLSALLITAQPPAATSSSEGGGSNPGAVVPGTGENYGEGWNNYGYDGVHAAALQQRAKTSNGGDSPIDR